MLALLAVATLAASAAPSPAAAPSYRDRVQACTLWNLSPTARSGLEGRARRLGDLPLANHELTLLRWDARGCSRPVVVREAVNGDGRFAAPRN